MGLDVGIAVGVGVGLGATVGVAVGVAVGAEVAVAGRALGMVVALLAATTMEPEVPVDTAAILAVGEAIVGLGGGDVRPGVVALGTRDGNIDTIAKVLVAVKSKSTPRITNMAFGQLYEPRLIGG